ncbi:MAG: glycosyltransferase family 39 protein [Chloroflexia bacterium]
MSPYYVALAVVMLFAAALYFYRPGQNGYGNNYYAATVKSMLTSWHNFFFASFDPGGFVTVDKPPLGFWLQAGSVWLFGFSGFSLMLPQALAAILSIALLFHLVNRAFGPEAALIAAAVMAVTPIMVADSRVNELDSILLLTLLLAAWACTAAAERANLRLLLLSFALVGLAFNVKMLQAFLVLPALYLLYLLGSAVKLPRRLLHVALATILLAAVSLSWAVAVDLTPPGQRPYIGSSRNNTVVDLITGHNGLERLGLPSGFQAPPGPQPIAITQTPPNGQQAPGPAPYPRSPGGPPSNLPTGPGPAGRLEGGPPGPLRLFNRELAGQVSWLLPLALLGLVAAAMQSRLRLPLNRKHQALLLWSAWLGTCAALFSFTSGLFHPYYVVMLAPAISALAGAGLVALYKHYNRTAALTGTQDRIPGIGSMSSGARAARPRAEGGGDSQTPTPDPGPPNPAQPWLGWLLPVAILVTAALQIPIVAYFPTWAAWLIPTVGLPCLAIATALVVRLWLGPVRYGAPEPWIKGTVAAAFLLLLTGPTAWSLATALAAVNGVLPYAVPQLLSAGNSPRNPLPYPSTDSEFVEYLHANNSGERYLVATQSAQVAAPIILSTGQPVMALGGFSGGDPILTPQQILGLVAGHTVRFFLLAGSGPGARSDLSPWVMSTCKAVPDRLWRAGSPSTNRPFTPAAGPDIQLYDCAGVRP